MRDQIRYQNVISKRYKFYYEEIGRCLQQFLSEAKTLGVHPKGEIFYALNNVPSDGVMNVEFFLPIKEESVEESNDIHFHSYFSMENMMSLRVRGNFETGIPNAYSAMLQLIEATGLKQISPIFHMVDKVSNEGFITVKIAYIEGKGEKNNYGD